MKRIYVASSWKNARYPAVVEALRKAGHEVYDFRNPPSGTGFSWREVLGAPKTDPKLGWPAESVLGVLKSREAYRGFKSDMTGLQWADACVLVLPCGRSAHLELGWAVGRDLRTVVLLDDPAEPDLMHLMADRIVTSVDDVLKALEK